MLPDFNFRNGTPKHSCLLVLTGFVLNFKKVKTCVAPGTSKHELLLTCIIAFNNAFFIFCVRNVKEQQ